MAEKSITQTEASLVGWFMSQIDSLKYNGNPVSKLTLTYDKAQDGISIELVRENETQTPAPTT